MRQVTFLLALLAALGSLGACDDGSGSTPDPIETPSFVVGGAATGLLKPVSLRLEHNGGSEILSIISDGPFAFSTALDAGESYAVVFVGESPCALVDPVGVITSTDARIELWCEGTLQLTDLTLSATTVPELDFDSAKTEYQTEFSLLQSDVSVTVETAHSAAAVTVAGVAVTAGTASKPLPLDLGVNIVDIVVTNPAGASRTYRIIMTRAFDIAQTAYAKASNTDSNDRFGSSVAISGDTLVVGAPFESAGFDDESDNSSDSSGAAYVFRRMGATWKQEAYLKSMSVGSLSTFGSSVAISGDTIAVGSPLADVANDSGELAQDIGAVDIFRRNGTTWEHEAFIQGDNSQEGDTFGFSLALDGDTLVVGAPLQSLADNGTDELRNSGATYVFRRIGTTWTQEGYLKASNPEENDTFGWNVALSGDTLAVSAPAEDSAATGIDGDQGDNAAADSGAVYVFRRIDDSWTQEAYVKASNTDTADQFGDSLALWGDTLAVGANLEDSSATGVNNDQDSDFAPDSGAVYVFRRTDATWKQEAYIKSSNTDVDDRFGASVTLSGDILAVGAHLEDSAATGTDGLQDNNDGVDSGAVYVFRRSDDTWAQEKYIKASNTDERDDFGLSVALSGGTLAIGAEREDSAATGVNGDQDDFNAPNSGAVYIFF